MLKLFYLNVNRTGRCALGRAEGVFGGERYFADRFFVGRSSVIQLDR